VIKDGGTSINAYDFFSSADSEKIRVTCEDYGLDPEALPLSVLVLIIDTGKNLVLVDTGLGEPVYSDEGKFIEYLSELHIDPEDVDVVIITHGHWDHIGGIANEEGQLHFPNAQHVMSRTAWEYWTSDENLSKMSERLADWARKNLPPLKGQVELIEDEKEILPGISMFPAPGHTTGQMAVLVESNNQRLLCLADVAHNPIQMVYPDIGYSNDMDQEEARSTRSALVDKSMNNHFLVYGCHFPFPGLGYVEEIDGKPVWKSLEVGGSF
jgi:glyoxylase-like metal-dependent hydrolase (beta-lactamase superfamily II)